MRIIPIAVLALLVISLSFITPVSICQMIYISPTDRINGEIQELQDRGYLGSLSQTERPWIASDVVDAILADEISFDPASRVLAQSILSYLEPPQRKADEALLGGGNAALGLRGLSRENRKGYYYLRDILVHRNFKSELGSIYKGRIWLSREKRWGMDSELIFDSDGTGYPWYYGTPHNARIIGQFDRAYLKVAIDRFDLLLGRQRFTWGPSARGSLLIDDKSPPLDMIAYSFRLSPFTLSGFGSRLNDYIDPLTNESIRRFLAGHRLRVSPGKGWEFAFSEIYVYGGQNRLPELYYSIPLVLYYWEAQNRKVDDNAFWAFDLSWVKGGLGRLYTQFVFDDIQRQHRGPQKWAYQFGGDIAPAKFPGLSGLFEINFVDTYVYGQRIPHNAYLNWGRPLSRLDSDQREYFAGLYKRLNSSLKIGAEFVGREKGAYYAADLQPSAAPLDSKFPSGIVEKTYDISLSALLIKFTRLDSEISLGYQKVTNFANRNGDDIDQSYVRIEISYGLNFGLPLWTKYR